MQNGPFVSVIMSMFNAERFLEQAVRSILEQTYRNFEFIIIDDGSKDGSWDIAARFSQADPRIRLIRLEKNQGVSTACNAGLEIAKGKYIARMDSDDVSLPDRLCKQVSFMEAHPNVGILGCGMRYADESGNLLSIPPQFYGDLSIRWNLLFESPFFNPTTMLRKSLMNQFELRYEPSAVYGEEDYELWIRFLLVTRGEILPEVLLHYRLRSSSLSHRYSTEKYEYIVNISSQAVATHLPEVSIPFHEIRNLQNALRGMSYLEKRQRAKLIPLYFKIWDEFRRIHHAEAGLAELEANVIAWAARMILYPPFQPRLFGALWNLTKRNWQWPILLLKNIPYYRARRRIR